jgi:hypothetical protein
MFDLTIVDMISKGLVTQEEPDRTDLLEEEGSVTFIQNTDQYVMMVESEFQTDFWSPVTEVELIKDDNGIILQLSLADDSFLTFDADEEISVKVYQIMERNSL